MLTWDEVEEPNIGLLAHYQIIRRYGAVVPFEPSKIANVMMEELIAVRGTCAFICGPALLSAKLPSSLKLQSGKANGFFSASKANLRNAP